MLTQTNIISLIEDLLFENDCVIIPQFGGFVVNSMDFHFEESSKKIEPKKRWIAFNEKLKTDDGFLVSEISNKFNLLPKKVKQELEKVTQDWKKQLSQNETLFFGEIGYFTLNDEKSILFIPSKNHNFNPSMYGLPAVSTIINLPSQPKLVRPEIVNPILEISKPETVLPKISVKKESTKTYVYLILFFFIAAVSTFVLTEPNVNQYESSLSPIPKFDLGKQNTNQASPTNVPKENLVQVEAKPESPIKEENVKVVQSKIELIAGSFLTEKKANQGIEELKSKGIDGAYLVQKNETDKYYRISIGVAASMEEGYEKADSIKKNNKLDIWVFEKK